MPKKITYETKNYLNSLIFGPGVRIGFDIKYKTYDENIGYRKKKKLDVYDNGNLIGKCERINRTWICYIKTDDGTINKMELINKYIKKQNLNLPELIMIMEEGDKKYYCWYYNEKGFFIRDKVHNEIKKVARYINKFYFE